MKYRYTTLRRARFLIEADTEAEAQAKADALDATDWNQTAEEVIGSSGLELLEGGKDKFTIFVSRNASYEVEAENLLEAEAEAVRLFESSRPGDPKAYVEDGELDQALEDHLQRRDGRDGEPF